MTLVERLRLREEKHRNTAEYLTVHLDHDGAAYESREGDRLREAADRIERLEVALNAIATIEAPDKADFLSTAIARTALEGGGFGG